MKYFRFLLSSILVFLIFNTCKKEDQVTPANHDHTVYNVTLTENTVYIDSIAVESITQIDTADYAYYFESNDPAIADLQVGNILLIHGLALRRVTNISQIGSETRIETAYATLNEAIRDGEISWNKEIRFNEGVVPIVDMNGEPIQYKSATSDGYEFEFKYGDYTYKIKFSFSETRADVDFEISKDLVNPVKAKFTAKGFIEKFYSNTEMQFENSKLTKFNQSNQNMKGELTLNLTVAGSGRDEITFKLPVVLLKFPILVGSIPASINLKVLFVINCVVPVDGSSQVEAKFSYNSTTGAKYDGLTVSADASVGEYNIEKTSTPQTGASSAIAANFGLAFPRLEVAVFNNNIVPWIQTAFLIGGDFTFTPACQQAKSMYIGACGLDLSFLGFGYSADHTFWKEEKVFLQTAECP
jgi:hypothetical protein